MDPASPRKARGQDSNPALPAVLSPKQPPVPSVAAASRAAPASPRAVAAAAKGTSAVGDAGKKPGSPPKGPGAVAASPGIASAGAPDAAGTASTGSAPVAKKKHVAIAAEAADKDASAQGLLPAVTDAQTDKPLAAAGGDNTASAALNSICQRGFWFVQNNSTDHLRMQRLML